MRIGLYHEAAGTRHAGGVARFVRQLGTALAEDHTVYLYTGAGEPIAELADADVRVMGAPSLPGQERLAAAAASATPLGVQTVEKLATAASARATETLAHVERNCDLLFTHQWLDDLLLARLVDVPTVYEYHGLQRVGVGARARERLSTTEWVVANSAFTGRAVADAFDRRVDGVVRPGVDVERFAPAASPRADAAADGGRGAGAEDHSTDTDAIDAGTDASDLETTVREVGTDARGESLRARDPGVRAGPSTRKARAVLDRDEPVVLFVGRLSERKGLADLLAAADRLETDAHLLVVGRGDVDRWRRRAADRGLAADATVLGEVPAGALPELYRQSTVCCTPSHYESYCMVNLEAMACGAPVVTTPVGGITEYATDGESAALVPPEAPDELAAALDRLLARPEERAALGEAGRDVALDRDWSHSAAAAEAVFERVLD